MSIPVFGEKLPDVTYQDRYAAYIIIATEDRRKILLVQAPNRAYFLPGGEIEAGEDEKAAIHRESMEELGCQVTIGDFIGRGDDYFYSRNRKTHYYNPAYFYQAVAWEKVSEPLEEGQSLEWCTIADAIAKLKRGSHKWAVQKWEEKQNSLEI